MVGTAGMQMSTSKSEHRAFARKGRAPTAIVGVGLAAAIGLCGCGSHQQAVRAGGQAALQSPSSTVDPSAQVQGDYRGADVSGPGVAALKASLLAGVTSHLPNADIASVSSVSIKRVDWQSLLAVCPYAPDLRFSKIPNGSPVLVMFVAGQITMGPVAQPGLIEIFTSTVTPRMLYEAAEGSAVAPSWFDSLSDTDAP